MSDLIYSNLGKLLKLKFLNDVTWTFISSVILGISGIIINIIVIKFYGAAGFGSFTLALSIYMLLFLFTVFGVNNSVIKYIAEDSSNKLFVSHVITTAFLSVLLNSLIVTSIAWFIAPFLVMLFKNPAFTPIFKNIIIGLPLFSLNKLLMSFLNGLRRMKAYSFYNALRYVLVVCIMIVLSRFSVKLEHMAYAIPLTEAILFISLMFDVNLPNSFKMPKTINWFKTHYSFGFYSFLSDGLADINSRIDYLLIGYFLTPAALGIYAFASEIAKGFTQFAIGIQINFNPIISKLWSNRRFDDLKANIAKVRNNTYLIYLPIVIVSLLIYPFFVSPYMKEVAGVENIITFYILLLGVFVFSGYISLMGLLTYTGYVTYQFKKALYTLLVNTAGCILLIPLFGIIGAAISTSLSFIFMIFVLNNYSKNKLGINLLRLK